MENLVVTMKVVADRIRKSGRDGLMADVQYLCDLVDVLAEEEVESAGDVLVQAE